MIEKARKIYESLYAKDPERYVDRLVALLLMKVDLGIRSKQFGHAVNHCTIVREAYQLKPQPKLMLNQMEKYRAYCEQLGVKVQ
jgi:hypothetical protein